MNRFAWWIAGLGVALAGCSSDVSSEEELARTESAATVACGTGQGKQATKAALATAMAMELGRWDPLADLRNGGSSAIANCSNCPNTKAILGQQFFSVDQNNFNATSYASDLVASFSRQSNLDTSLRQNHPERLPVAHRLTKVGGPTRVAGACNSHFLFQADRLNGTPLTATEAANLRARLCYFGVDSTGYSCGNNAFVAFVASSTQGCPSGRTCISVDSTVEDSGFATLPAAGSAPTYPFNRAYSPSNTLLNSACTTTAGKRGTMKSKCSAVPATCGDLYCTAT